MLFAAVFLFGGRAPPPRPDQPSTVPLLRGRRVGGLHVRPRAAVVARDQGTAGQLAGPFHGVPGAWRLPVDDGRLPRLLRARDDGQYGSQTSGARALIGPAHPSPRPWLRLGGFALYAWLLAYMMVWTGKNGLTLGLFAVAMGLHLFTIASNLSSTCREAYHPRGALLLASA